MKSSRRPYPVTIIRVNILARPERWQSNGCNRYCNPTPLIDIEDIVFCLLRSPHDALNALPALFFAPLSRYLLSMGSQMDVNIEGQIPDLSIRDMISLATRQVKGVSRPIENGYAIELRDYSTNLVITIALTRSMDTLGGTNFMVHTGHIKEQHLHSIINIINLEHLYVTWDTPGLISFCFAGDTRYSLVNVSHDNGVFMVEDVDRRADQTEDETELSESERRARALRRTFYHIGTLFAHDDPQTAEQATAEEESG